MTTQQPTTMAQGGSGPGPGSDYAALSRRVREAGLLKRRHGYYVLKVILTLGAAAAGWAVFFWVGNSWWQLAVAAFLGVVFTQLGVPRTRRRPQADLPNPSRQLRPRTPARQPRVSASATAGGSTSTTGTTPTPTRSSSDPDIGRRRARVHPRPSAGGTRTRPVDRPGPRPTVLPAAAARGAQPARRRAASAAASDRAASRWLEGSLLLAAPRRLRRRVVFLVLSRCRRSPSSPCTRACSASTWAARSPRTTRACRSSRSPSTSWTSCAGRCSPPATSAAARLVDFALGGLNYQIEHHLFPSMPRPNLRRAQPIVEGFCAERGVSYLQTSFVGSYVQVLSHLHAVGAPRANPGRAQ